MKGGSLLRAADIEGGSTLKDESKALNHLPLTMSSSTSVLFSEQTTTQRGR